MPSANPQPVVAQLTRAAIFLVVTVNSGSDHEVAVRTLCGDLAALLRAVGFEVGKGEFGAYFIGYARSPRRIERMLVNMFVGQPPGNYDRLLDFSRAVTGALLFVPSATFLARVAVGEAEPSLARAASEPRENEAKSQAQPSRHDGSLGIGSLKKRGRT